jgi:dolichol-phosphate mannosyltransferase
MQLVTILGLIVFVVGLGASIEALVQFFRHNAQDGFTTVIILQCFTGSFIMFALGIIGFYISKIYEEVKGRPKYIIDKTTED